MIAPAPTPPEPARVLIIKPSALGDVLTALPVLRGLRRTFPNAHVAWLVNTDYAPLLAGEDALDAVVEFDRRLLGRLWRSGRAIAELRRLVRALRTSRYDWAIDLQGLFRSGWLAARTRAPLRAGFADAREHARLFYTHRIATAAEHTIDRNVELARRLGIDARREDLTLHLAPEARAFAERFCAARGLTRGEFVVCVPPTRWPTKLYPQRRWPAVAAAVARRRPVVLLGTPGDRAMCRQIADASGPGVTSAAGETTIPQMAAVIAVSAGVICCDSAAKFIASAVGVGAVVLVGPTRLERTGPLPPGRAVVADVPCQGCLKRRCRHVTCMELIRPEAVVSAAEDMLAARSA